MKKTKSPFFKNIKPIAHLKYNPYSNHTKNHSKSQNIKGLKLQNINPVILDKQNISSNIVKNQGCINHPQKQQKFFIVSQDQEILNYCQKCAIQLASRGFCVEKIKNEQIPESQSLNLVSRNYQSKKQHKNRKQQIDQFLSSINLLQIQGQEHIQQLYCHLQQIKQHFKQQRIRAQSYYTCLSKLIKAALQKTQTDIQQRQITTQRQLEETIKQIQQNLNYLKVISRDITGTRDIIIQSVKQQDYRPIFTYYQQCTDKFIKIIKNKNQLNLISLDPDVQSKAQAFSRNLMQYYLLRFQQQDFKQDQSDFKDQQQQQFKNQQKECNLLGSGGSLYFSFQGKSLDSGQDSIQFMNCN